MTQQITTNKITVTGVKVTFSSFFCLVSLSPGLAIAFKFSLF